MGTDNIALIAHLMRRAGFGATRTEIEAYAAQGYDATVEALINPPHTHQAKALVTIRSPRATVDRCSGMFCADSSGTPQRGSA